MKSTNQEYSTRTNKGVIAIVIAMLILLSGVAAFAVYQKNNTEHANQPYTTEDVTGIVEYLNSDGENTDTIPNVDEGINSLPPLPDLRDGSVPTKDLFPIPGTKAVVTESTDYPAELGEVDGSRSITPDEAFEAWVLVESGKGSEIINLKTKENVVNKLREVFKKKSAALINEITGKSGSKKGRGPKARKLESEKDYLDSKINSIEREIIKIKIKARNYSKASKYLKGVLESSVSDITTEDYNYIASAVFSIESDRERAVELALGEIYENISPIEDIAIHIPNPDFPNMIRDYDLYPEDVLVFDSPEYDGKTVPSSLLKKKAHYLGAIHSVV